MAKSEDQMNDGVDANWNLVERNPIWHIRNTDRIKFCWFEDSTHLKRINAVSFINATRSDNRCLTEETGKDYHLVPTWCQDMPACLVIEHFQKQAFVIKHEERLK